MQRATTFIRAGEWPGAAADRVMLDYDDRRRRRMTLTGESGLKFLLDLARAPTLVEGDGLVLEDGRIVEVGAAPEKLLQIACVDATHLARIAYHLGNRHLPVEVGEGVVYIRADHVIEHMVRDLGASVEAVDRPFYPEGGAYGEQSGGHHHHHDPADDDHHHHHHHHGHDHDHSH